MKNRWLVCALAVALAFSATAQKVAESVQVTIIEVPVTVVDRDGNPVRGLTKENFEVFDEGKKVPIEYFEVLDMKTVALQPESTPLSPVATRNFLLLFDLANSQPGNIGRAADAAKEFVDTQLAGRDLAAVATFTAERGARMVTSFTNDKVMLKAAIQTLGDPNYFKVGDPLMLSYKEVAKPPEQYTAAGASGLPMTGQRAEDRLAAKSEATDILEQKFADSARSTERQMQNTRDTELKNRLRAQLSQMGNVARVLDRLHGRKQIILLSEGFDAGLVTGREDLSATKTREEADKGFSGEIWEVNTDQRYGSSAASRDVTEMTELFRRSDVVLHAIDIRGLRGNTDVSDNRVSRSGSLESLFLITKPTGGTVFRNTNDLKSNFAKMLEQQSVVYVLGFSSKSSGKPGKFHSLKVKTDARGARLSHRSGYYEPSTQITDLERTLSMAEILASDAPIDDVDISVAATTLPGPGGKARVPVVVEMAGPRFLEGINANTATANLYVYAFDQNNQVVDYLTQRIALDLTKAADTVRGTGIRYFGTLRLPAGKHAVKAIVRVEESGRIGFVRQNLDIPAFTAATVMPPVFFTEAGNWVMLAGSSRGDDYAYPFAAGDTKYVPQSQPDLKTGNAYKLALFLNRMPLENLGVTPALVGPNGATVNVDGQVKLLGRTSADERGSVKLLFDFKPEGLSAGAYQLRFTVTPKDGAPTVVSLPFNIL
jgi:VWFA-related protein